MISAMDLAPGRYQVRVAAGTPGRAGSVLTDLEVPDFREGALAMSGVAISSPRGDRAMTVHGAYPIGDDLPVPPTTVRRFERTDEVAVAFEIYSNHSRLPPHTLVARAEFAGRMAQSC